MEEFILGFKSVFCRYSIYEWGQFTALYLFAVVAFHLAIGAVMLDNYLTAKSGRR